MSVGSGFIAARATTASPFGAGLHAAGPVGGAAPVGLDLVVPPIRVPASAKPSPISTPLTAWIPISAAASLASSRSAFSAYEPRPGGTPVRAPRRCRRACRGPHARRPSPPPGRAGAADLEDPPATSTPISPSSDFATEPAATWIAVWRALARFEAFRTSSWPNLSAPARSACPGRGSVRASSPCRSSPRRAATGSFPTASSRDRGCGSRARAAFRACGRA